MFRCIKEVKILLDNDNIFHPLQDNEEYYQMPLDEVKKTISFLVETLTANNNQESVIFSLICKNPFYNYTEYMKPIFAHIHDISQIYKIKIYTNGSQGTREQYEDFKTWNSALRVDINPKRDLLFIEDESLVNLLTFFPLTSFNFHIDPDYTNLLEIRDYYKQKNIYELNFDFDTTKVYSDEVFEVFEEYLNNFDTDIIETFESGLVPLVPTQYKHMFWKLGVNNYFIKKDIFRHIPEGMNGIRCGLGCNQQLIVNWQQNIYSCAKIDFNREAENEEILSFKLGSVKDGIDADKISNLITCCLHEEVFPGLKTGSKIQLKCSECDLNQVCIAGCSPINYYQTGKLLTPTDAFCKWNRLFFNHAQKFLFYFDMYQNNNLFRDFYLGCLKQGEPEYVC